MVDLFLTLSHGALLLLFGVVMAMAFAGIRINRDNSLQIIAIYLFCCVMQVIVILLSSIEMVWKLYPVIVHIPLILFLYFIYHKKLTTSVVSVLTAYLFCQPAKWFGLLAYTLTGNDIAELVVRMMIILIVGLVTLKFLVPYLSELFSKGNLRIWIFGITPAVYYAFDYVTSVYTNIWLTYSQLVSEFLPFFICIMFVVFCVLYHSIYAQKSDAERNEYFMRLTTDRQKKEMVHVNQAKSELKLLRHDMRLLLNNLAVCINNGEKEKALELMSSYSSLIDETKLEYFCAIDTINYVLSSYTSRFEALQIDFTYKIEISELKVDEILFSSILANALDNAVNAQENAPLQNRNIRLMLKTVDNKLLLSVKNPANKKIIFADGLPVSDKKGHGYGTQSIRYMAERLGGNCQFSVQDGVFSLRVII